MRRLVTSWLLVAAVLGGCAGAEDVLPVYLTWSQPDAMRTITVQYHTVGASHGSHVHYDREPRGGDPAAYVFHAVGFEKRLEGVGRTVHVVELSDLEPGGTYWFVVGDPVAGYREERSFRLPAREGPLTFVTGGDMGTGLLPRMISARAAAQSPSFAAVGGDMAYAYGAHRHLGRWWKWFSDWEVAMRTPEGHLVPMLLALGNHELRGDAHNLRREQRAPLFDLFFHQGPDGRSFFERSFGPRIAFWVLDTGHLASHLDQRDWLEAGLRRQAAVPFRFALYHIGLYPAHHPFDADVSAAGREHWLPLFDQYRLTAAFENHDHVHKRTWPLRAGERVASDAGTLYLGGGCWGKAHVERPHAERPYLAKAIRRRHFWRVTVDGDEVHYTAIGAAGQVLDSVIQRTGRPAAPGSQAGARRS